MWGIVWGLLLNVVSTSLGAWFGLCLTRGACRPVLMRALGRYRESWQALDSALSAEGWQIALLIRLAPVAPLVVVVTATSYGKCYSRDVTPSAATIKCQTDLLSSAPSDAFLGFTFVAAEPGLGVAPSPPPPSAE